MYFNIINGKNISVLNLINLLILMIYQNSKN